MDRRQFLKTTTATVAAAGVGAAPWRSAQAQAGPIKIGLLAPLTGVVASGGKEMVEGVQFYLDQVKSEMGGRKVELVIEDDASNPDTALQKARRLVEQGNCHMLIGDLLANTGLAVANYVKGTGTPYFIPIIAADDLTQRARIKNVIRVAGYTASAFTHPLGDWALKQGYKKIATISQDYTFGHEQCGGLCPGVHRRRRRDRAAVLAPAQHRRLQSLSRPARRAQGRCDLRDGDRRRCHPLHPAICQLRPEGEDTAA